MKASEAKRRATAFAAVVLLWMEKQLLRFPQQWIMQTFGDAELQTALLILVKAAMFGSVLCWLRFTGGAPLFRGWYKKGSGAKWLILLVPMLAVGNAVGLLGTHWLHLPAQTPQPPVSLLHGVLELVSAALLPAVAEEAIFRKEVQRRLLGLGKANALLCTAVLFALMHSSPLQMFTSFAGGLFLGLAALLWGPGCSMYLHLANNALALVSVWFGPVGGWAGMALAAAASLVWAALEYHKRRNNIDRL